MDNFRKDTDNPPVNAYAAGKSGRGASDPAKTAPVAACPECREEIWERVNYCPNCRCHMARHMPDEPGETLPVHASLQDKVFRRDSVGALCIQVSNQTGQELKRIEATIECPFVDESVLKPAVVENLADGSTARFHLNLIPENQGELLARIFITYWRTDTEPNVLEGETILYTLGAANTVPSIHIDGSVHANGAEIYGMDAARDIQVNINNSSPYDSQPLPDNFQEGYWRELPLKWALESTKLLRDALAAELRPPETAGESKTGAQPARGAWIRWELPGNRVKRVYLHFEPVIRVGRDADQEIICFTTNDSGAGSDPNYCISRRHLTITADTTGCRVEDHSTHGTVIDSYSLHKDSVNISSGQVIRPAGLFPLKYKAYRNTDKLRNKVQAALNASQSIQQSTFRFTAYSKEIGEQPLNAIRLTVLGKKEEAQYFALLRELDMGKAENAPLCLPCEDISELHAKLVRHNSALRIVDAGSGQGTWVNGEKLPPHGSRDLETNDRVQMGSAAAIIRYVAKKNEKPV